MRLVVGQAYLPFNAWDGALPIHLLSKPCERASGVITTDLNLSGLVTVFSPSRRLHAIACRAMDAQTTTALLDPLTFPPKRSFAKTQRVFGPNF
ncbi:MAG: hypothetical protein JWS10_249 [Cypionkella sp.]|nr:hypothetical protein [Cypionkella sp.]